MSKIFTRGSVDDPPTRPASHGPEIVVAVVSDMKDAFAQSRAAY